LPGEALALKALNAGTAQLPALPPWPLGKPAPAVGRSTAEALRAGVRRAHVAAALALARAQAAESGGGTRVALTGGRAAVLWPALRNELRACRPVRAPYLVLHGLFLAWQWAASS
jgi:pantothenate kinase type III